MSETIIERGARAILFTRLNGGDIEAQARAVLSVIREPTAAMIEAGEKCDEGHGFAEGCAECSEHWEAMIDEALK